MDLQWDRLADPRCESFPGQLDRICHRELPVSHRRSIWPKTARHANRDQPFSIGSPLSVRSQSPIPLES